MKKYCIFDLDGTLLNTVHTIATYSNQALTAFGFRALSEDVYKQIVGNGAETQVRRMLARQEIPATDADFAHVLSHYLRLYHAAPNDGTSPYPGIPELLAALRKRGVACGVISNKPDFATQEVVRTYFGEDTFAIVRGAREGVPLKPAPDGVLAMLEEWQADPSEVLYIGDTGTDMDTGAGAGLETVGVLWGFRGADELRAHDAGTLIERPEELLGLLGK